MRRPRYIPWGREDLGIQEALEGIEGQCPAEQMEPSYLGEDLLKHAWI